jgi:hypothetical protein
MQNGNSACNCKHKIFEEYAYSAIGEQRIQSDTLELMQSTSSTVETSPKDGGIKEKREVDQVLRSGPDEAGTAEWG